MARKLKIMENEKHPLDELKNDEITKKRDLCGHFVHPAFDRHCEKQEECRKDKHDP